MPIYINRTNAGKNQMPRAGFESRSGHLIFSSICSVYIDRHIRVDLSDDEQYVRNIPCYIRLTCTLKTTTNIIYQINYLAILNKI